MSVNLGSNKISDIVKTTSGAGGTGDYNELINKPQINGVTLVGNLTTEDLNIDIETVDAYTKQETDSKIQEAVSTKADTSYVNSQLSLKADKSALESSLATKADADSVYTKEETTAAINSSITGKADKTYVDSQLTLKADKSTTYTKTEVDNSINNLNTNINSKLNNKADKSTTYTKDETNTAITNAIANKTDKTYVDGQLELKADKTDTYTKEEVDELLDNPTITGDTYPIGAIAPFAGTTTPQNWLLCDGREVSRETYSELFAVIGTTWGAGDGSTSFNLPNLSNRFPVGAGDDYAIASTGGEKEHTLTIDEMPSHTHTITGNKGSGAWDDGYLWFHGAGTNTPKTAQTSAIGSGQPHNNMPPYAGTYYIIKAKQSAGVLATVVDTLNSSSSTDALSANQGKILNEKGLKKLWENPSPNNTFSSQSITLSSDDYDYLIWDFDYKKGLNKSISAFSIKGQGVFANAAGYWEPGGATYAATIRREVTYVNDKSFNVESGCARYGNNTSNNSANDWLIPVAVYGGKF